MLKHIINFLNSGTKRKAEEKADEEPAEKK